MRTYDLILEAGKDVLFDIDYKFFLVLADGGYSFDVALYKGSISQKCEGVAAGFGLRLAAESRGKKFIFNSANAQTIKIFVGDDEAIYQRLSGTVTVNGGTFSSVSAVTDIINEVKISDNGSLYGASWKINTAETGGSVKTVFTPAANANGAIIHDLRFVSYNSSNTPMSNCFLAKNGTPTSATDGDLVLGPDMVSAAFAAGKLINALKITAGKGLYFYPSSSDSQTCLKSCLYELL